MTLTAGVRLGPYEIVELLGKGGMGVVYRARDPRLGLNFSVGANYVWRKADNLTWNPFTSYKNPSDILQSSDYVLAGTISGILPDGTPYGMPYWKMSDARRDEDGAGIDHIYTNREGYTQKYQGIEIFATKRLSNKWMLNASFNYQRDRGVVFTSSRHDSS